MSATAAQRYHPVRSRKSETLQLRLPAEAKALVAEAASMSHTSLSEFVLRSALREAEATPADRRVFSPGVGRALGGLHGHPGRAEC